MKKYCFFIFTVCLFIINKTDANKLTTAFPKPSHSKIYKSSQGQFEVGDKDLGTMNWLDARKACMEVGKGWRLPTKEELNLIYFNKNKMGVFVKDNYWSDDEGYSFDVAWCQNFDTGEQNSFPKINKNQTRPVRSINQ
jgi:hypothetical protein